MRAFRTATAAVAALGTAIVLGGCQWLTPVTPLDAASPAATPPEASAPGVQADATPPAETPGPSDQVLPSPTLEIPPPHD